MCGFAGFCSGTKLKADVLLRMTAAIKHRGPDDEGYFFGNEYFSGDDSVEEVKFRFPKLEQEIYAAVGMGFRRLSIVDLSANGHQPMFSESGNVITFNGEIYNFKEIRKKLEVHGVHFDTQSDTEVILKGFEYYGTDIIQELDGMFSFALFDRKAGRFIFARDRIGLKPFFYFINENGFFWASEIKALLESKNIVPKIDWVGLQSNFTYTTSVSPSTCFEGIQSLQPGHFAVYDVVSGQLELSQYFDIREIEKIVVDEDTALKTVEKMLQESVSSQLYADVPVISMMSGGIDSTLISALAKNADPAICSFTVAYENGEQEVGNAALVAKKYDIRHQISTVDSNVFLVNLKSDIAFFEEPYVAPEVLTLASKFAAEQGFKVLLSGNGADELFGGYTHLLGWNRWKKLKKFSFLKKLIPQNEGFGSKLYNFLSLNSAEDFFRNGQGGMKPHDIQKLFLQQINTSSTKSLGETYSDYFAEDILKSLGSHHVYRDDLSAMKNSVEFRYPYLSNSLLQYVASLPESYRFNGRENKPFLRRIAEKYLPEEILKMKKRGFSYPFLHWYQTDEHLRNFVAENLQLLKNRGIFRNETIDQWYSEVEKSNNLAKIWQLVTFEIWHQTYIDAYN